MTAAITTHLGTLTDAQAAGRMLVLAGIAEVATSPRVRLVARSLVHRYEALRESGTRPAAALAAAWADTRPLAESLGEG